METRAADNVYLINSYVPEILGAKLPSYHQTFGHFLHLHKVEKMTIRDASRQTIKTICVFWGKAGIPVRAEQHCMQKLESVFYEWKSLLKHKSRTTEPHKMKEKEFVSRLDDLFDIAHSNALSLITISEDREFLLRQREKGRPGSIDALDRIHERKIQRATERRNVEAMRQRRTEQELEASTSKVLLESSSSSSDGSDEEQCMGAEKSEATGTASAADVAASAAKKQK